MEQSICKNINNLRDLGGVATSDGKRVRTGCFLRGGTLNRISKRDMQTLQTEYHLSAVIDLRTETERSEKPDIAIPGVQYLHMPVFDESTSGITHEAAADSEIYERIPDLNDLYRVMVLEECAGHLSAIMQFLCTRSVSDGAVLFHCTEGKDRTGIISMLLLSLLHVPIKAITADYLLTNRSCRRKSTRYYWLLRIFKRNKAAAERVRDVFLAKEEYLLSAYTAIQEAWGSMDNFAEKGLHLDRELLERFAEEFTL